MPRVYRQSYQEVREKVKLIIGDESCMKRLKWRMRRIKDQYPRFFKGVADVLWLLFLLLALIMWCFVVLMALAGLGGYCAISLLVSSMSMYISECFRELNHGN